MFGLAFGVLGAGIALKFTDDMIKELNKDGKKAKKRNRKPSGKLSVYIKKMRLRP